MRYVYLHGFASGPQSRKATVFWQAFAARETLLEIPDLAQGDFGHLTISGQLALINRVVGNAPVRLVGSSMGGYLAALYAAEHPETVDRLVLLAPAFDFARRWRDMTGTEALDRWRTSGWMEFYHYADKANRLLHYGLVDDALQFPAFPDFRQQALIFHGTADPTVPIGLSQHFCAGHTNARLIQMASGHELTDVLDEIVTEAIPFLFA